MLLNKVRERYWIENGLVVAKQVLKKCAYCASRAAKEIPYTTAPLHATRYNPTKTFDAIGIDMFGPMEVTMGRGKRREKRFAIIFTCCLTRAINVELVRDATAYSCFLAFKRHASTYGQPRQINSDRGTNFHQMKNLLHDLMTAWQDAQPLVEEHFPTHSMGDESSTHPIVWRPL